MHWSRRTREETREAERIERAIERAEDIVDDPEADEAEAIELLRSIPVDRPLEGALFVRAADCFFDLAQEKDAERFYRRALELDPDDADALHGLGLVYQAREDHDAMVKVWLEVRRLDLSEPAPPWAVTADEFTEAAEAAFAELPKHVHEHLENLPIVVTDYPDEALIRDGVDPRILGLITGIPFSHKRILDGAPELDCVQLYQRNIERIATSKEEVLEETRITVLHETAHYFGLDDDELDALGLG